MKKPAILILTVLLGFAASAQPDNKRHGGPKHKGIAELVGDLTSAQKHQVESISKESAAKVSELRSRQKTVKDSIRLFMDKDGDQSAVLYPLFDREASLQVQINREMYHGKVRIDAVLTDEQRAELRQAASKRPLHKNHK